MEAGRHHLIILVHGFFRNAKDMDFLSAGLKKEGRDVLVASLPTTFGSLEECARSLYLQIYDVIAHYERVTFVAHSMGGLIVRLCLPKLSMSNITRCIFIATPHKGSKLADILGFIPVYRQVFKPIGDLMTENAVEHRSKSDGLRIGVIAGVSPRQSIGGFLLSNSNDGRVDLESALSEDADEFLELPFSHYMIHRQNRTLHEVEHFITHGRFEKAPE